MAVTRGAPSPLRCFWWRSNSVEISSQNALANCNVLEENSCEIVDVDGAPKRPGLDAFFARLISIPADIDVYDGPSKTDQQMARVVVIDQPESGSMTHVRLVARGKTICEGDYSNEIWVAISGTSKCFKAYDFTATITPIGYRYADGHKVGYVFDIVFRKGDSDIHVVSKP
jgi:hypothetical protein